MFREASRAEVSAQGAELDAEVDAYVAAARERWPDLGVQPLDFARYIGERAEAGGVPPLKHAGDLLLACACVQGEARAFQRFGSEYGPVLQRLLMRRGATQALAADIQQQLAERLLVADPGANRYAKIADYRGLGALRNWVATSAAMLLVSWQRSTAKSKEHPKPIEDHIWIDSRDPGAYLIETRALGRAPWRTTVSLAAGERRRVDLAVGAAVIPEASTVAAERSPIEPDSGTARSAPPWRPIGWGIGGLGLLGLGVGAVAGALVLDACPGFDCRSDEAERKAETLGLVGDIGAGVGVAALVASTIILLASPSRPSTGASWQPVLGLNGEGAMVGLAQPW